MGGSQVTDRMPKQAMEYFADVTGMPVTYTVKNGLNGAGKVRVPMTENMRLVCPTKIVASMYRKTGQAAILLHVRQDLYVLIGYDCNTHGAAMLALNGAKIDSTEEILKRARDLHAVYKRCGEGIVKAWGMQRGGSWIVQSVDSVV